MPERGDSGLTRYAVAVASIFAATAVRVSLNPVLADRFPFATLFLAVMVAAWFGGFGPALLASALGCLFSAWFLLPPRWSVLVDSERQAGLILYAAVSAGVAVLGGGMHRARRRAEVSAREADTQREQLRVTLESIGDAVIVTDTSGLVTSMNRVATQLTGWEAAQAAGRPLEEVMRIVHEETRQPVPNPVYRVLADGRIVGLANHTVLLARDGVERPIDDSAAPIRDRHGHLVGVVLVFRDVTQGRRALASLRRSEEQLSDLFENANVGLHFVSPEGVILRANQAELEMLGYACDEYVGHHIAEFHVDREVIDDILRRLHAGETLTGYPARMRCRDGSARDVLINSSVLWEDGRFVHTRCFTLDVTTRRHGEKAQALLAAVVESSEDAIVTKTLEGVVTSWNAGAENLFGFSAAEAVGQSITIIYPRERLAEERDILSRLRRGERIEHFETQRVARDGRLLDISLAISPVRDGVGQIVGASMVARDITGRKRTEKALGESEERFRLLADNIAQFAWIANADGGITWYNRRWFDYTGTTLEQMEGWGWQAVHHPDHVERVTEKFRRHIEAGEPWEDTFPLRSRDGEYRWFLSRAIPIRDDEGKVLRWFGTNTDVTAQRDAEEALRIADRRKDSFLATLAHELRNPLAPLRNSLEILKQSDGDGALARRAEATMDRQLTHLERLVDDLLDIARVSRDQFELRRERVSLSPLIEQAVESVRTLAERAGIEIAVELSPEPIELDADPVRLAQVFTNLLNNACKYSEAGGRISISTRGDGGDALIAVRDTGVGIPGDMLTDIFDMFTQVSPSADRVQSGLGIGLTLVRRLVEMHGGTVEARSDGPGRGSEFVVRIPRSSPLAAAEPDDTPAAAPAEGAPSRRVLVVDDNADAAESLELLLQINGHQTQTAHDGEAALRAAESFRPDVVLLDIGLPLLSGYEVARRIRAADWGREITLIALTGWGQDDDRQKSDEAGIDHHLVKPVDAATILGLLAEARA